MHLDFILDLVQQRLLAPHDLLRVLTATADRLIPLGRLALERGLLTVRQVNEIHTLQETSRKSFGSWAIALGWLSSAQVQDLLALQQMQRPDLATALVEFGMFAADEVRGLARGYRARQAIESAPPASPRRPKFRRHANRTTHLTTPHAAG